MIVLCPVPGLVRRRCPAAHRNPLPRWIQTVNPLTMGFVQQSPAQGKKRLSGGRIKSIFTSGSMPLGECWSTLPLGDDEETACLGKHGCQ